MIISCSYWWEQELFWKTLLTSNLQAAFLRRSCLVDILQQRVINKLCLKHKNKISGPFCHDFSLSTFLDPQPFRSAPDLSWCCAIFSLAPLESSLPGTTALQMPWAESWGYVGMGCGRWSLRDFGHFMSPFFWGLTFGSSQSWDLQLIEWLRIIFFISLG